MIKKIFFYILVGMICASSIQAQGLDSIQNSAAYKQYQTRPENELSKLIYLLDRFNIPGIEMKVNGNIYTSDKAFPYSKSYLAKNYKKEKAEDWIRAHCYRSSETNDVIYMSVSGGEFKPARDVLLEELAILKTFRK